MKHKLSTYINWVFLTGLVLLSGCGEVVKQIVEAGPKVLDAAGDALVAGGNPPLMVAGLAISTLAGIWAAIRKGMHITEIVGSVDDGFKKLDGDQKKVVLETIGTSMSPETKKIVAKVKKALGK